MTNEQPTYFCTTDNGQRGSALFAGIRHVVVGLVFCVYAIGASVAVSDQSPVIGSLSRNGELVCTNLTPGTVATVEWAPSATGPWTDTWTGLDTVPVDSDGTIRVSVPMFYRVRGVPASASMVLIPAGTFTMGNCMGTNDGPNVYYDDVPLHTVYVSAFYIDRLEVSKALWDEVFSWAITRGYEFSAGWGKAPDHPVCEVGWFDAVKWCNARSEMEGRVPAYYVDAAQTTVYRTGQIDVQNDWVNWHAGYRLPTEAEWEKAARGGVSGRRFPWSDSDIITHSRANYEANTNSFLFDVSATPSYHPTFNDDIVPFTSPAGSFAANGYGLHDMAGNVWEWCWDWYGYYSASPKTDPQGPQEPGWGRVVRGGAWNADAASSRCSARRANPPRNVLWAAVGFRSVRGE